jgi:hypothetical protein
MLDDSQVDKFIHLDAMPIYVGMFGNLASYIRRVNARHSTMSYGTWRN